MLKFRFPYLIFSLILFLTEIYIAVYVHDDFIRPYVGDFLVVILIYCMIRSFFSIPILSTAIFVLLFAYTVEVLQYLNLVEMLGLQHSKIARTVIGTSFEWGDMIAYTLGIGFVLLMEHFVKKAK